MSYETNGIEEIVEGINDSRGLLEEAIEELRSIRYIEDDYSALEYLIYCLKDTSILLQLSSLPNPYVRLLSTLRLGELMDDEHFLRKMRDSKTRIIELTALLRGRVRSGRDLHVADLVEFYKSSAEIDELIPEAASSFEEPSMSDMREREILLKAALFSESASLSEEFLLDSWERFPDLRFLTLDAADRDNLDIQRYIEDIDYSNSVLALQATMKATKRGLVPKKGSTEAFERIGCCLEQLKRIPVPENALVQFSFLGDPFSSGKGSSGGMGTFIRSLGNELVSSLDGVVTVVLAEPEEISTRPLYRFERDRHLFLYVPLYECETKRRSGFAGCQSELISTVSDMLEIAGIKPFAFHMRFSDYASLAMLKLGRRLGVKNLFTLTPDPQHRFVNESGRLVSIDAEKLLKETERTDVSWRMLSQCDSVVGIGGAEAKKRLFAYYPSLVEDEIAGKIRMVPEGISLRNECPIETGKIGYEELFNKERESHFAPDRKGLPLMLTVGRLDPSKGQYRLLKAWGETELNRRFNLLIIGGDLENPDSVESEELEKIREYLSSNGRLREGFCHIPAMDNDSLRCLEASIVDSSSSLWPPVYVAPSLKEEFGIAILEAMAAGFVAFGPRRGGVKSYVKHSRNGFLIDTTDEISIRNGLSSILLDRNLTPRKMKLISTEGSRQVYRRFSISIVAKMFAEVYLSTGKNIS